MSKPFTILVVDDEFLLAMDLQMHLRQSGYDVIGYAATVEAALAIARGISPALALVDINLEGKFEGIELARQLKERHGSEIIFITAYSDRLVMSRAEAIRPAAILHKPFEEHDLFDAIERSVAVAEA